MIHYLCDVQRYFITLRYNGSKFFGWQRQPNQISIQQVIEDTLSKVHSNKPVKIVGCGRTDTGVHANHYIFHVDLPSVKDTDGFVLKLNRMLPDSIVISSTTPVNSEYHARFDAIERTYRYYIHNVKNPFKQDQSFEVKRTLDFEKMNKAAEHLIGKHDFTSFSKIHSDVKTEICTVQHAAWIIESKENMYFEISSNRFLRNMVRAIVGTLMDVGLNKIDPERVKVILESKDRQAASSSSPAQGLFLWDIKYKNFPA